MLSDVALDSQEDNHTFFHRVLLGIKTAENKEPFPVMDVIAQVSKDMLQLRQGKGLMVHEVTVQF